MPKPKPPVFSVEYGRVISRDGKAWVIIATPHAFFNRKDADGKPIYMGATPDEADDIAARVAFLLSEYGEHE